jgi:hypothetical protein
MDDLHAESKLSPCLKQLWGHPAPYSNIDRDLLPPPPFFHEEIARHKANHFVMQPSFKFCLRSSKHQYEIQENLKKKKKRIFNSEVTDSASKNLT